MSRRLTLDSELQETIEMVETVIAELGLSPKESRINLETRGPAWGLEKGSAKVFVFINPGSPDEPGYYIQVVSPVMKLPIEKEKQLALFTHLLRLNAAEHSGAAFGLKDDTVVLKNNRSTIDLDPSEVKDMILGTGYYADIWDDTLVNEYGGFLHSD